MSSDSFHQRGRALEDKFFHDVDEKLMAKLRAEQQNQKLRQQLGPVLGIEDAATLDHLIAHKITAESSQALSIVPLIMVVWADGVLDETEKAAIGKACRESGIDPGSAHFELIKQWLGEAPSHELLDAWKDYVRALKSKIEPAALQQLKSSVLGRARGVAQATGGFLGLGSKISPAEDRVLQQLEAAFQ